MVYVVGLRSPIAFRLPGPLTTNLMKADLEPVAIRFEGWEFIWHPPMKRETDGNHDDYGPMLSVVVASVEDDAVVAPALQRFFSALAFHFNQPVEDVHHGAVGGDDPWNPHGVRVQRYFAATHVLDAPKEITVEQDETLWLALAIYREGTNASSPIYRCLCFKNVLDAVFEVRRDFVQKGVLSPEAEARDKFVNHHAGLFAEWHKVAPPESDWGTYFRDEIRNAAAHVIRAEGKRVLNPDRARERVLLQNDASVLLNLASEAIGNRWPTAVVITPRAS